MAHLPRARQRLVAPQIRVVARWNSAPRAPDLRTITELWRAANGALDLGFTPEAIIELMRPFRDQSLVSEVIGDGYDYKNTIVGAQVTELHGRDLTGTHLSETADKQTQFRARALFRKSMMEMGPVFADAVVSRHSLARSYKTEIVFLPLVGVGGAVSHFITAMPLFG